MAKEAGVTRANRKPITEFFENMITDLDTLELDIKRFEYSFLNKILLGEEVTEAAVNDSTLHLLVRMRELESVFTAFDAKTETEGFRVRRYLADLKKHNSLWKPYATAQPNDGYCTGMASRILTQSRITIQ